MHLPDCLYHVSFRRYRLLNLPLNCEVVQKGGFWAPGLLRGWDTPDFGHTFSNYTYFRPCGQIRLSSVRRAQRLADEKRKKEEQERKPGKI